MKKSVLATAILLTAALLFSGCGSSSKAPEEAPKAAAPAAAEQKEEPAKESSTPAKAKIETLKLGFPDNGKNAPADALAVAHEKGFIAEELNKLGVKFELIPFVGVGPAINEALASKSLDVGIYGDTPGFISKSAGTDTTLIAAGNTALGASFVVPIDSPITSVKELKGKKVATAKGSFMHRTFIEALKAEGLTVKDVEFFNMNGPESDAAILSKKIDAAVLSDSSAYKYVVNKTGKIIAGTKEHPDWAGHNLAIARTAFARENPEVIVALIKGLIRGEKYANENQEETKKIWAKGGTPVEVLNLMYPDNKFPIHTEITQSVIDNLTKNKDFLLENGLIKNDVDLSKWIDKSYYEQAIK